MDPDHCCDTGSRRSAARAALLCVVALTVWFTVACSVVPENPQGSADPSAGPSVHKAPGPPTSPTAEPTPPAEAPPDSGQSGQSAVGPSVAPDAGPAGPATDAALVAPAVEALPLLAVKGRAPKTGYSRTQFGDAWSDDVPVEFGHNGCDTRNDILHRDLTDVVLKPGTHDCVVLSGVLEGPYSGEHIDFRRGSGTSSLVQIDHVVALSDAWQKGAQQLDPERRRALANDPLELVAVSGHVNTEKGDGDAATWLPPSAAARCGYVARQVLVKQRYDLWVTPAEHDAIEGVLGSCDR